RIEGLDTLVNLTWLDLSFNNIEVIGRLDALTKLEDLSLCNNRISVIENMDHLNNLQVLSLGNNKLVSLENLIYLRRFESLRSLSLNGNPLAEDEQYKMFIAAHLPDLVYLDFRLLDENIREIANVKYQYSIEEIGHNEALEKVKRDKEQEKQRELDSHKAAFVEYLNGPFFFESMYVEDPEGTKIAPLPGVTELMDSYPSHIVCASICQSIFDYGLGQHQKREAEESLFNECLQEALCENQALGVTKIKEFEEQHLFDEVSQIADQQKVDDMIYQYNQDIGRLSDSLLHLELQLVSQTEVRGDPIRDLENDHHEKVTEVSMNLLEKVIKGEMDEDMSDDLRELFSDKDTVLSSLITSHEMHLLKIDNREDDIITKINSWSSYLIKKVHSNSLQRNRKRVSEISRYIDHLHDELDNLELHEPM
uniref:Dynein regulatory complex subunit 3 n=1 Tax=Leptobrachium leishanense TaxID=445787 RepID=A0A8C5QRQ3_9ANUR